MQPTTGRNKVVTNTYAHRLNASSALTRRGLLKGAGATGLALAAPPLIGRGAARAAENWPVGWVRATTGPFASTLAELYVPGLIALEQINAGGGVLGRKMVQAEEDDQASPAAQPAIARKLHEMGVNCIVGPAGTSPTLASLAVTTELKMLQAGFASHSVLGDARQYPYHYHIGLTIEMEAEGGVEYAVDQLGLKKIGIMAEASGFGDEIIKQTVQQLAKRGLEAVSIQQAPSTTPDVAGYVGALQDSGAEAVMMWYASRPFAARIFSTMSNVGFQPEAVVGHYIVLDHVTMENADPEVLERTVAPYYVNLTWKGDQTMPAEQIAFAEAMAASGIKPSPIGAVAPWYDFLKMIRQAAEDAGSLDSEKLKAAMDSFKDYNGLLGPITFTPDNHVGIGRDAMVMVKASSHGDPRAMGVFRERL